MRAVLALVVVLTVVKPQTECTHGFNALSAPPTGAFQVPVGDYWDCHIWFKWADWLAPYTYRLGL
jgi:hypothetical protein